MAASWKTIVKPAHTVEGFNKAAGGKARGAADVLVASIDKQIELFKKPNTEGKRWFTTEGDNVGFTIRYANSALKLVGEEKQMAVPKAQFLDVMAGIRADVAKGDFKAQLDTIEGKVRDRSKRMSETRQGKATEPAK